MIWNIATSSLTEKYSLLQPILSDIWHFSANVDLEDNSVYISKRTDASTRDEVGIWKDVVESIDSRLSSCHLFPATDSDLNFALIRAEMSTQVNPTASKSNLVCLILSASRVWRGCPDPDVLTIQPSRSISVAATPPRIPKSTLSEVNWSSNLFKV